MSAYFADKHHAPFVAMQRAFAGLPFTTDAGMAWRRLSTREHPLPNCWLGTSIENQDAIERVEHLRQTPAAARFLSVEPMIGPVDLTPFIGCGRMSNEMAAIVREQIGVASLMNSVNATMGKAQADFRQNLWVVVGCESGPKRRPCNEEWARSLVEQCKAAGVACYVKQLDIGGKVVHDMEKFPTDLQIRQLPKAVTL